MSEEIKPLEALERLGVFHSRDLLLLDKNILQLYIKIKGKKLTKIKNLYLESYYDEVYKVKNNTIYYQETYDQLTDVLITFSEDNWKEYGIIDFIGKKEDYEPKVRTIPMKEWKSIESALNDNYFYKHIISKICDYMGLDIKPFEDLVKTENEMINYIYENECFRVDVATNKNKLKAFEIIKEKNVCIHDFKKSKTLEEYNGCREWGEQLTQEEFDLLKEVLL